jgi:clan AA aspartic protease
MMTGFVTDEREGILNLTVFGTGGEELTVEALIDTGSDGYLTLPPELIEKLQLPWLQSGQAVLADGSESYFDIHGGVVLWDDKSRRVLVDAIEAPPLIGMSLLEGYEMIIQVIRGGGIVIRPIESTP